MITIFSVNVGVKKAHKIEIYRRDGNRTLRPNLSDDDLMNMLENLSGRGLHTVLQSVIYRPMMYKQKQKFPKSKYFCYGKILLTNGLLIHSIKTDNL